MNIQMKTKPTVVRVTATEFELSDGRVFPHIVPLDVVPTPEEFQNHYDKWSSLIKGSDDDQVSKHPQSR